MKIKFNESSVAGIAGIVNNASLGPLAKIDSSESKEKDIDELEKEANKISSDDNKEITLEEATFILRMMGSEVLTEGITNLNEGKIIDAIKWNFLKFSLRFLDEPFLNEIMIARYQGDEDKMREAISLSKNEKISIVKRIIDAVPQEQRGRFINNPALNKIAAASSSEKIGTAAALGGGATAIVTNLAAKGSQELQNVAFNQALGAVRGSAEAVASFNAAHSFARVTHILSNVSVIAGIVAVVGLIALGVGKYVVAKAKSKIRANKGEILDYVKEKTGRMVTESEEVDYEGAMAKSQLRNIIEDSQELMSMITDESQLPAWIQSKLTIAEHNLDASLDYMKSEEHSDDKESLTEAKASDVKGNGPIANMAREYLEKYPTFFTFRVNEHIKLLEKTLGNKQNDVIKVIVGGLEEIVSGRYGSNRAWTGTTVVAFTEDKIYAAQKGYVFKEYVKTLNRDKIDDVTITTGMIYAKFSMEDLHVGIIHKKALPELKEFFEKYIDSKIKMKSDSKIDKEAAKLSESFKLIKFGTTINEALALPKKGEEKNDFISRFMGSELAKKEFPDNKQRVAVAYSQWSRIHKEEKSLNESKERHPMLVKYGVEGFNKPKRTPDHKTKSHLVVAKKGDEVKVVRFGAQGVKGSPKKEGESESYKKRRQGFVARHKAQNPSGMKDKFSALYWANKVKW
jgi:hypothetical protein